MASSYRDAVLADGAVGYWRLDDSTGPIAADSVLNPNPKHPGSYINSPQLGKPGALRDGNASVTFDAVSSQYVEIANPISNIFSQPTSADGLTVEAWLRPDLLEFQGEGANDGHYLHWLGKGEAGIREWTFRLYSASTVTGRSGRISFYCFNPDGLRGAGAYFQDFVLPGVWLHVVGTLDPGDGDSTPDNGVSIYKNGVLRQGPSASSPGTKYLNPAVPEGWNIQSAAGSAPLRFGTRDSASFLTGGIDEVAIYPRVLSAAQILNHYQVGVRTRATSRLGVSAAGPANLWLAASGSGLQTTGQLGSVGCMPGNLNLGRGKGTVPD